MRLVDLRLPLLASLLAVSSCATGAPETTTGRDLAAVERATLRIAITDSDGAPVTGWAIAAGRDARTEDGTAVFVGMLPGPATVTARADGFAPSAPFVVDVPEAGEITVPVALAPRAATGLMVELADPEGDAVDGVVFVDGASVGASLDGAIAVDGIAPGSHTIRVEPEAPHLLEWTGAVEVSGWASVHATLAARPGPEAVYLGSQICGACHAGHLERWEATAHARARRTPEAVEVEGPTALVSSLSAGVVVPTGPADVHLARAGAGSWSAEVIDGAGASTGPLPVVEVYGGHLAGAALVVQGATQRLVLPVGWSLEQGWVSAWTDGWFDGDALRADPGPEAAFDLRCAGCHATGFRVDEADGAWSLVASDAAPQLERAVGCEACHGPGSEHPEPDAGRALRIHRPDLGAPTAACSHCHQRVDSALHPLTAAPGPPLDSDARLLPPWRPAEGAGSAAPDLFVTSDLSRSHRDQVGAFLASPHAGDWAGRCSDCHASHGSDHTASLHEAPADPALCTSCHRAAFPDDDAIRAHGGHPSLGAGGPSCVDCHLPRAGVVLARDPLSGTGETRDHGLRVPHPADALAAFDSAGEPELPVAEVPVTPCLDCHSGAGAAGDPTQRATWVDEVAAWDAWEAAR